MRIALRLGEGEVDVEVAIHDPAATVAHLAAEVAPTAGGGGALVIDGRLVVGEATLIDAGLRPGSAVGITVPGARPALPPPKVHVTDLLVVGGLAAGARHPLGPGCTIIGRDPGCGVVVASRTTSGRHAAVFVEQAGLVTVADAGSSSGTWIDGRRLAAAAPLVEGAVAATGACLLRVAPPGWREPAVLGRRGGDGRRPLHRPPAAPPPAPPAPLTPPPVEAQPVDGPRFGWAAALVPLLGGLVLARLVDPRLALFTLLGPAVLIGQWLEDRRRHRHRRARAEVTGQAALVRFVAEVDAALRREASCRHTSHPDPPSLGLEIEAVGSRLWSRRPHGHAFGEVSVGTGPALPWRPPTATAAEGAPAEVLAAGRLPPATPAVVPLCAGRHLGIAGARPAALAVARWVVLQLAAHHGPADLRITVACEPGRAEEWSWLAYLPHTSPPDEVAGHRAAGGSLLVAVVDGEPTAGGLDTVIGPAATSITLGPSRRALPGRCTSVLELDGPDGWGRLATGGGGEEELLATGVDRQLARSWARSLAALSDPEQAGPDRPPPHAARLLDLLGIEEPTADAVLARWSARRSAATPIGATVGGAVVELDLVADGPHALVAGTTGAGKSELLRSLVAGLAASEPPDRLALLLVDYKGGAAFADAARLPHVIGVVTDLGPDEAARALESLEAELRRREAVLAELGLRDLAEHPAHRPGAQAGVEPLPRLVVVVDELAALAAELPTFLDHLVQLAARGRSLGLHLVLATQRPGGVVSPAVRTNCAIRVCLRVPDEADAVDVVGSPAPARLGRRQAGRGFLRRGAGDLVEVQVALAAGSRPVRSRPVTVHAAGPATAAVAPPQPDEAAESDLALLVTACRQAAEEAGQRRPRPLWQLPLPATLAAADLGAEPGSVVVGLLDDPGRQRQVPLTWRPTDGPLVCLGGGRGPARALEAAARVLAAGSQPGRLHVYGLDFGAQALASLRDLPHVGAVVGPGDHERLHRLVRRLADDLAARQARAADVSPHHRDEPPLVLVLVDGVAGLRSALDGAAGLVALDRLERVVVDGPGLGMAVAVTADRLAALPHAWSAAASRRLAFRGGDPLELLALGGRRLDQSAWPEGRCLDLTTGLLGQVATGGWPAPVTATGETRGAPPVEVLARRVELASVLTAAPSRADGDGLHLSVGIDGRQLGVAVARLRPGQPFVVCGAPGSGRSTALAVLAASARAAGCAVTTSSPDLAALVAERAGARGVPPLVVVADDADRGADDDGSLSRLAAGQVPGVHLVASAAPEALRTAFGHWSGGLRRAGAGVVLRPRSDLDGDVLGIPLLPRWPVPLTSPGRGVLVLGGEAAPVQLAIP